MTDASSTAKQQTIRGLLGEFKVVPLPSRRPLDDRDITYLMEEHGLVKCGLGIEAIHGFTAKGMKAIEDLARQFRQYPPSRSQVVSNNVLAEVIRRELVERWYGQGVDEITDEDIEDFMHALDGWFATQVESRTHIIPCRITPSIAKPFSIGPVTFSHLSKVQSGLLKGVMTEQLLEFAKAQSAEWFAEVTVSGREQQQSAATADLVVDVALGAFQALCGSKEFHNAVRVTGRARPVYTVHCRRSADGQVLCGVYNLTPGLTLSAAQIDNHILRSNTLLDAMGRRIDGFLNGKGPIPELDEAWCNAVYWYHEALSETLETVAVAKLETAIEVLFRAEKSSGSKRRLVEAFRALFGMNESALVKSVGVTVEDFAASIVKARSRVLHGTWPTIHPGLPSKDASNAGLSVVEPLVRALITSTAKRLSEFANSGVAVDAIPAFLAWAERSNQTNG